MYEIRWDLSGLYVRLKKAKRVLSLGSDCRTSATSFKTFIHNSLVAVEMIGFSWVQTYKTAVGLFTQKISDRNHSWLVRQHHIFLLSACDPHSRPCKQFMEPPGRHLST